MPAVLALPAFWGAVAAGTAGAATVYGAHKAGEASDTAAATSAAANKAAIEEQQRQDAIQKQEFDQQQAAAKAQWDAQQQIRAPYRQAGSAALSSLGGILGVDFGSGGGGAPSGTQPASSASGPMPSGIDWTAPPDQLGQSLTNYFQKAGVSPTEVPYWVGKAGELVARGKEIGDPNYANKRLAAADIFGGARGGTTPISAVMPRSLAPPMLQAGAPMNALAPSYGQVVPISSLMGGA